jgi:hypothetical protein
MALEFCLCINFQLKAERRMASLMEDVEAGYESFEVRRRCSLDPTGRIANRICDSSR